MFAALPNLTALTAGGSQGQDVLLLTPEAFSKLESLTIALLFHTVDPAAHLSQLPALATLHLTTYTPLGKDYILSPPSLTSLTMMHSCPTVVAPNLTSLSLGFSACAALEDLKSCTQLTQLTLLQPPPMHRYLLGEALKEGCWPKLRSLAKT